VDGDTARAGVVEHHRVEFTPQHLPGAGRLVVLVVGKVERLGELARTGDKLHALLADKPALTQRRQNAEPLEHPEGLGDQ
jgi:hypothetical protein